MDPALVNPKTKQHHTEQLSVQRTQSLIWTQGNIHLSCKSLQDPNLSTAWSNTISNTNSVVSDPFSHGQVWPSLARTAQGIIRGIVSGSLAQVAAQSVFSWSSPNSVFQMPGQKVLYRSAHPLGKAPRIRKVPVPWHVVSPASLAIFKVVHSRTLQPKNSSVFEQTGSNSMSSHLHLYKFRLTLSMPFSIH